MTHVPQVPRATRSGHHGPTAAQPAWQGQFALFGNLAQDGGYL